MRRDGRKTPLQTLFGSVILPQEQQRFKKCQPGQFDHQRGKGSHQRGDGITAGDLRHDRQRPPDHQVVQEIEGQGEPAGADIQTNEETSPGGVLFTNVILYSLMVLKIRKLLTSEDNVIYLTNRFIIGIEIPSLATELPWIFSVRPNGFNRMKG